MTARRTVGGPAWLIQGGLFLLATAVGIGCGRKGDPRPPEFTIPKSPEEFRAERIPAGARLTWSRPTEYADGQRLDDLRRFWLLRACPAEPSASFAPLAEVVLLDRDRFRRSKSFLLEDRQVPADVSCRYRIVAETEDGYQSAMSEAFLPMVDPGTPAAPDPAAPPRSGTNSGERKAPPKSR